MLLGQIQVQDLSRDLVYYSMYVLLLVVENVGLHHGTGLCLFIVGIASPYNTPSHSNNSSSESRVFNHIGDQFVFAFSFLQLRSKCRTHAFHVLCVYV